MIARRKQLGDQLLVTFEATDQALNRLLAGLSPQDWERPCYHPGGLFPIRRFMDFRLGELVIHGWDIRSRFEPKAPLSPETLPVLLDVVTAMTPGWGLWPGAELATPGPHRFSGEGGGVAQIYNVVAGGE